MKITAYQVNAFTHLAQGGNPAGVVLDADNLSSKQMQSIAKLLGFSETAFISKDTSCDFHLRFFTPNSEVDFCGHATVASFHLLFQKKIIKAKHYYQRTKAGNLAVTLCTDGLVEMQQALPQFLGYLPIEDIALSLNISSNIIRSTNLPIEKVSTGLADIIIPVPQGYLDQIVPNYQEIHELSNQHKAIGYHVFELSNSQESFTASCRNFAPAVDIDEESATGSACGALASYLFKHQVLDTNSYLFQQGRAMNCLSTIKTHVSSNEHHNITQVKVSGYAQLISQTELSI